jgi:predicted nucleic acid-binding protein
MAAAALPPGLIDTDVLIDAERGLPDAVNFLAGQHAAAGVHFSAISAMELLVGCRNQRELQNVLQSVASATVHELSPMISRQARDWLAQFSLSHGLQIADALIAATAAEQRLPLYTKNVRHFQMLPSLSVIRPY